MQTIFREFSRLNARASASEGMGLGLAIVKKIVEEHLGEIRFDDAEGGGACVTLRFAAGALEKLEEGQPLPLPKGKVTAHGA